MAWGSVGTAGTFGNSGNNQVNFSLTTTATIEAGNCGVLILVADNARTTDGDDVIISGSITDSAGNTWTKAIGWCNANAAAQAGVALEVWYCKLGTQLASAGTISGNFTNTSLRDAACGTVWEFTCGAGSVPIVQATNQDAVDANTLTSAAALNATTPSAEYLRIRAIAAETNVTTDITQTASWTRFAVAGSGTGTVATEVIARGEFIVTTGTGSASDPSHATAADWATVYVALGEVTPITRTPPLGTLTLTAFAPTVQRTTAQNHARSPGTAPALTLTTVAPRAIVPIIKAPTLGTLTVATLAPTAARTAYHARTPSQATLTFTTAVPAVVTTGGAVGLWRTYNFAKGYLCSWGFDLDDHAFNIALFTSASNVDTATLSAYSQLTGEIAGTNKALVVGWTPADADTMRFTADDVSWAGAVNNVKYAGVYDATTGKVLSYSQLYGAQTSVPAGSTLVVRSPQGIFELT